MGIQTRPGVKFQLIQEAVQQDGARLSVAELCRMAGVSRSGYYAWLKAAPLRQEREEKDREEFGKIKEAYNFRGYNKGARGIQMRLLHETPPVIMNLKKIRRLMKKYGLQCPIRKPNPYRQMMRAMRTNHVAENVVQRAFKQFGPRQALLTDITYLFYNGGVCYFSPVIDVCTHEVLAYKLSDNLKVDFVLSMVDDLLKKYGAELDDDVIVHSDQGCHYTSNAFIGKLREAGFIQSMSRKGNCWDNAPQESFFGHMKDEIKELISRCKTTEEVREVVDDWMDYYNHDRYQWDLRKLSPSEYYTYLSTGVYPLPQREGDSG